MKAKFAVSTVFAMCSLPIFPQSASSASQPDSLSQVLLKKIEDLIAPIQLHAIYFCDSVPISVNLMQNFSFVKNFSGWNENSSENSRMGYVKSKTPDLVTDALGTHYVHFNIFFYAKVSEQVEIYKIKPDMTYLDFISLGEIPGKELAPTKILTLKAPSEKNIVRFDEVIFHKDNVYTFDTKHFNYVSNTWIENAGESVSPTANQNAVPNIAADSSLIANTFADGTFTDSRDGHKNPFKIIGTQIWMAENLAYLPSICPSQKVSDSSPFLYVYGYEGESVSEAKTNVNFKTYGVLYNYEAAKTACPKGWHLPSDDD